MFEEWDRQKLAWNDYCDVENKIMDRVQQLTDHFGSYYVSSIPPPTVWNTLEKYPKRERPYTQECRLELERDTHILREWMCNELPEYENPHAALAWLYFEFGCSA